MRKHKNPERVKPNTHFEICTLFYAQWVVCTNRLLAEGVSVQDLQNHYIYK